MERTKQVNVYISDTHFGHSNIIKHAKRPFDDVGHMNFAMLTALRIAEAEGHTIIHLGDVAFNFCRFIEVYGWLDYPERHVFISGNHDPLDSRKQRTAYSYCFGSCFSHPDKYKEYTHLWADEVDGKQVLVQLSHAPVRITDDRVSYALFGHVHERLVKPPAEDYFLRNPDRRDEDFSWTLEDPRYFNVCVEVTGYRPVSLQELVDKRRNNEL